MRISEKTLEATLAAQLSAQLGLTDVLWLGLTQKQERLAGLDLATDFLGQWFFLQFKASNVLVRRGFGSPRRKFMLPHQQLVKLQVLAGFYPDSVYYLLPDLGDTADLKTSRNIVPRCWLLRVADLSGLGPPTNAAQTHRAYIDPPDCLVLSDPTRVRLWPVADILRLSRKAAPVKYPSVADVLPKWFDGYRGRKLYAMVLSAAA